MKFDYCIGNPPYQGNNHYQVYTDFYLAAQQVSNYVDMVFPTGWQEPKDANNLSKLNKKEVKEDRQIVLIDNKHNLFANVPGAEWTNVILWKKGYDNGLDGKQRVLTDGKDEQIVSLKYDKSQIEKPKELVALKDLVLRYGSFVGMDTIVSVLKPYGLRTDFLDNPQKYNLPSVSDERTSDNDISIYGLKARKNVICFAKQDYPIPKVTKAKDKYKVLLGKAWGNFSKGYLGGAYADIIIAFPNEICTENYLECGCFDTYKEARDYDGILKEINFKGFDDIEAGIVKWPMSVIRLTADNKERLIELADKILSKWRFPRRCLSHPTTGMELN